MTKMMNTKLITIDGSRGEGGGQVLRTSLGLSLVTGTPFRIEKIRAGRKRPGLMRQHLTAVHAAVEVGSATVAGDQLGSSWLEFYPGTVRAGDYEFDIGSAGSTSLVMQTILPALLVADAPSTVTIKGGTHNPMAPPFEFLDRAFLPILNSMGPRIEAILVQHGFYPAGGGEVTFSVAPATMNRLELIERGAQLSQTATAFVSDLPAGIAHRELKVIKDEMGWSREQLKLSEGHRSRSPGNFVCIELQSEHVCEVVTAIGEKSKRAVDVAADVAQEAKAYLASDAPVGLHLADQLLIPMALAGGGKIRTLEPTMHTKTNADIIEMFLPIRFRIEQLNENQWEIEAYGSEK